MNASREVAASKIEELKREYGGRGSAIYLANEAQTRLLLIDSVLEALGWKAKDFNPETNVQPAGYIDYLLTSDRIPYVVVEAKRFGQTFAPSQRSLDKTTYKLSFLKKNFGANLSEVINQAQTYAQQREVPYAVVTNGADWFLFCTRRMPGFSSIDDQDAFYFGHIFKRFGLELFWNLLNRDYVVQGKLGQHFSINRIESDFVAEPRIEISGLSWKSPDPRPNLAEFYTSFFGNISDPARSAMLKYCYVTDASLTQYQGDLQRALRDTAPAYISATSAETREMTPDVLNASFTAPTGDRHGSVIIVTGSAGCGKSTFVAKSLNTAKEQQRSDQEFVVIDLINEVSTDSSHILESLWDKVYSTWIRDHRESAEKDMLKKIFGQDLARLKSGPYADVFKKEEGKYVDKEAELLQSLLDNKQKYLVSTWNYYKRSKRTGIAVFFDNVDLATENFQRQVYALAHSLAHDTGANAVITMREVTFFRGREARFLGVRSDDTVYHLQSPNLLQVLSRRISYIEDFIDEDLRVSVWKKARTWDAFRPDVQKFAATLKTVFLTSPEGAKKIGVLAAIAWHNVRTFFSHLSLLHSQIDDVQSDWTLSAIVAVLMTSPTSSASAPIIPNIYRPVFQQFNCYFLKLRIILYLIYGVKEHAVAHGTPYESIERFARNYGYDDLWTERAIEDMVQTRLLECVDAPAEEEHTKYYVFSRNHTFRRTPFAVALTQNIVTTRLYTSLAGYNLPFHNQTAYREYSQALADVLAVGEQALEPEIISLIEGDDSNLAQIVSRYLLEAYELEQPSANLKNFSPEVANTEHRLDLIVEELRRCQRIQSQNMANEIRSLPQDTPLFDMAVIPEQDEKIRQLRIPQAMGEATLARSTLAPMILWSLVALQTIGKTRVTGAEIARTLNEYLLEDNNAKLATNISRELRHLVAEGQSWLIQHRGKRPLYSLKDGWEMAWVEAFHDTPPQL